MSTRTIAPTPTTVPIYAEDGALIGWRLPTNNDHFVALTYEQLIAKYPACAKNIKTAYNSAFPEFPEENMTNCRFKVTVEPMEEWGDFITWMGTWPEPKDEFDSRVGSIVSALHAGSPQFPVFCGGIGSFKDTPHEVTEGFHRIIAFHLLGLPTVEVISVDWDATEEKESHPRWRRGLRWVEKFGESQVAVTSKQSDQMTLCQELSCGIAGAGGQMAKNEAIQDTPDAVSLCKSIDRIAAAINNLAAVVQEAE
jgi:hypothetical protein